MAVDAFVHKGFPVGGTVILATRFCTRIVATCEGPHAVAEYVHGRRERTCQISAPLELGRNKWTYFGSFETYGGL